METSYAGYSLCAAPGQVSSQVGLVAGWGRKLSGEFLQSGPVSRTRGLVTSGILLNDYLDSCGHNIGNHRLYCYHHLLQVFGTGYLSNCYQNTRKESGALIW